MAELSVFFDDDHSKPDNYLKPYLSDIRGKVKSISYEMLSYDGLECDLMNYSSARKFIKHYWDVIPGLCIIYKCVKKVIKFVLKNDISFYTLGITNNEIEGRVKGLLENNEFTGLHSLIIGGSFREFFESNLAPLFKTKFDKITYHP